ncbi:hypothetical protein [Mucilaginibacter lappiensis]|jgi:hypothetical protein|uniref:hypothetical protein n=1 Tax=Mucilaginibacter lappiensis TaxID=354630 RepID=UPI003D1FB871
MEEIFDTYKKRTNFYTLISCVVASFMIFVLACICFPQVISKAPQTLMVCLFLIGFIITIGSMFMGGSSIKTYIKDGHLTLTDLSVTFNDNAYFLTELLSIEINSGDYKGKGARGGFSDGTGNKIIITPKDKNVIQTKFVISSKDQRDNLTQILKFWKTQNFKIISNQVDLV